MRDSLALRRVEGNITTAGRTRTAWHLLAPQRLSFIVESACDGLVLAGAQRYADLVPRKLHLRVTSRPYAVEDWARALDSNTPDPLPGWADYLAAEQRHLHGRVLGDKLVYLGVDLRKDDDVADIVAGRGLSGRPTTAAETEWLLHRSVSLGHHAPVTMPPAQDVLEQTDLPELTDSVEWTTRPFGRSVRVVAGDVERFVVVLTAGRMQTLDIPARMEPWLQRVDRLSFPVEIAATIEVLPADQAKKLPADALARIQSQAEHFLEHKLKPPLGLDRQESKAMQAEDEITSDPTGLSTRVRGWFRFAVSGATEREALDRAKQLTDIYKPMIVLTRPADQYRLAREFIPGEPLANTAHERRMPVTTLAGAMPAATAMVGDDVGDYYGTTCGPSERAVMWDTHRSMEVRERSGLTLIAGGLGSGKSYLAGLIVYRSVKRGVPWVVFDPSGPLARLCTLPDLEPYSRHIDLLDAEPGTLNPYRVVPQPRREHYGSEGEWERQVALAEAQRRAMCTDVLMMLLPADLTERPQTGVVIRRAVRAVGGSFVSSPREVIDRLRLIDDSLAEHAKDVADELEDISQMPQSQLIFPSGYQLDYAERESPLLTVMTMRGLQTPRESKPRVEWTYAERFGIAQLTLAASLASRSIYDGDMNARKGILFDEAHVFSAISSGRVLLERTARDSRKHNVRALLSSQSCRDFLTAGIGNLIDSSFIGRTVGPEAQADALEVLGIERGVGYEQMLSDLSPQDYRTTERSGYRDFVFNDGQGGTEMVRPDLSGLPELAAALDTTPGAKPVVASNGHELLTGTGLKGLLTS